jgi:hypothetical protein
LMAGKDGAFQLAMCAFTEQPGVSQLEFSFICP